MRILVHATNTASLPIGRSSFGRSSFTRSSKGCWRRTARRPSDTIHLRHCWLAMMSSGHDRGHRIFGCSGSPSAWMADTVGHWTVLPREMQSIPSLRFRHRRENPAEADRDSSTARISFAIHGQQAPDACAASHRRCIHASARFNAVRAGEHPLPRASNAETAERIHPRSLPAPQLAFTPSLRLDAPSRDRSLSKSLKPRAKRCKRLRRRFLRRKDVINARHNHLREPPDSRLSQTATCRR